MLKAMVVTAHSSTREHPNNTSSRPGTTRKQRGTRKYETLEGGGGGYATHPTEHHDLVVVSTAALFPAASPAPAAAPGLLEALLLLALRAVLALAFFLPDAVESFRDLRLLLHARLEAGVAIVVGGAACGCVFGGYDKHANGHGGGGGEGVGRVDGAAYLSWEMREMWETEEMWMMPMMGGMEGMWEMLEKKCGQCGR